MNSNTEIAELMLKMDKMMDIFVELKNDLEEVKQDVCRLRMQFNAQFHPLDDEAPFFNEMDVQRSGNTANNHK